MRTVFILIISLALTLSSCQDFLNMPPKNVKVVYTTQDVKEAMSLFLLGTLYSNAATGTANSSYRIVYFAGGRIQFPFSRYVNISTAMCADEIQMVNFVDESHSEAKRGGLPWSKEYHEIKKWEGYYFSAKVWKAAYTAIGYLNMVLQDLSSVPDYDKTEYERISGEARVIRAYYFFKLNALFAPYKDNSLGIPMNFDAEALSGGDRWKQTDLYAKLIEELTDVLNYETMPKDSWNVFYNKRIIHAILAQIYQFKAGSCAAEKEDWANAEIHAAAARQESRIESTVEEQSELVYVPASQVVNKPHPFALLRMVHLGDGYNGYSPWGTAALPQQRVTDELYELYDANDIRVPVYFKDMDGQHYWVKLQCLGNVDSNNESHFLFRISDLLLIEAEAKARQGKDALDLLNEFKRSKIPGYSGYTGNNILEEILKERRKEFALEEQMRWMDMKRTGFSFTRQVNDEETNTVISYTLESNDYRYAFPIPLEEELAFHNIPQNPGWK